MIYNSHFDCHQNKKEAVKQLAQTKPSFFGNLTRKVPKYPVIKGKELGPSSLSFEYLRTSIPIFYLPQECLLWRWKLIRSQRSSVAYENLCGLMKSNDFAANYFFFLYKRHFIKKFFFVSDVKTFANEPKLYICQVLFWPNKFSECSSIQIYLCYFFEVNC